MKMYIFLLFFLSSILLASGFNLFSVLGSLPIDKGQVCYENFGCYDKSEISSEWPITKKLSFYPESPEKQNVTFYVFSCRDRFNPTIINYNVTEDNLKKMNYNPKNRTIFIVHGFTDYYEQVNWMGNIKDYILSMKPCLLNVIIVDWRGGSIVRNYLQAVANTRLVGFVIASLIKKLNKVYGTTNDHFTVMGHSLGGQISGFVGKNLQQPEKLRLIIGLDPAGPAYSDVSDKSRLNPNDANLVITIQTNGGENVANGLGILKPSGHYSFFPNGGEDQEGCEQARGITNMLLRGISVGLSDTFACSHRRAYQLMSFNESNFDDFQSLAHRCDNYEDFAAGKCGECEKPEDCIRWGGWYDYWQEQKPPKNWEKPLVYFIKTRGELPYSYYFYQVLIKTSDKFEPIKAKLNLIMTGNVRSDYSVQISFEAKLEPNQTYPHLVFLAKSIGLVKSINLKISTETKKNAYIYIDHIKVNYMNGYDESIRQKLSPKLKPVSEKDGKIIINSPEATRFEYINEH